MGYIMSAIRKIDTAEWVKPKSDKPQKATRILADGDLIYVELNPGKYVIARLYGSYHKNGAWLPHVTHNHLVEALHKFGWITKDEFKKHIDRVKKHFAKQEREYDVKEFKRLIAKYPEFQK